MHPLGAGVMFPGPVLGRTVSILALTLPWAELQYILEEYSIREAQCPQLVFMSLDLCWSCLRFLYSEGIRRMATILLSHTLPLSSLLQFSISKSFFLILKGRCVHRGLWVGSWRSEGWAPSLILRAHITLTCNSTGQAPLYMAIQGLRFLCGAELSSWNIMMGQKCKPSMWS